ncbi:zinc metalloprotease [Aspergillus stella-maris]|uniref:zinc metalloprotease n=1 Tax=Aspergillus stella-maris TaxID=1810926 RepID=UPI003CCDB68B
MRFLPILLSLGALASAQCGTRDPSAGLKTRHRYFQDKEDREAARAAARDVFDVTIDTYVHVVMSNITQGINHTTLPTQIHQQIDVLNENYQDTGFSFNLKNISYTHNNKWQALADGSTTEYEAKSSLRRGDYTALNLYFASIGGGILGYATFPDTVTPREFLLDGVVCDPATLPGGKAPYDLGITAVHETGHWLNLFHTFQPGNDDPEIPGCFGHGDYIHDTPAEGFAAFGCPKVRDTCTGVNETLNAHSIPGTDPIHNFMDYTDDVCLTQFTKGQILRMQNSWREDREGFTPSVAGRRVRSFPAAKAKEASPESGWF